MIIYTRKLKAMIPFFEANICGLWMDQYLYPLENKMTWFPLQPWLDRATELGVEKVAIQTYNYMASFVRKIFQERY